MDVAEFVAHNYYKDDTIDGEARVRKLLATPGVYFEGIPDNGIVLVYLTLSDEGLRILKSVKTVDDFKNGFSDRLIQHPGKHIYVFRMVTDGKHTLKELRQLRSKIMRKHNAPSFSWHDNNHVILHTYEV